MTNAVSNLYNHKIALDKQAGANIKHEIKPNDSQPQTDTFEKTGMPKKKKLGIAAAVIATAGIITGVIIHKVNRAKALKQIPKELKTIFNELKGEEGENFVNKAYDKLKKYMKLNGIAPEKIGKLGPDRGINAEGGFNPSLNTIEFTDGFFNKLKKADQFSLIGHELKHVEQISKIIRSGKSKKYASAWAESTLKEHMANSAHKEFHIEWNKSKTEGKEKEFLKECFQNAKDSILENIKINHEETIKLPKFKKGTPEYLEAENYIEATRNYTGLDASGYRTPEYDANIIEKEAYGFGDILMKHFKAFFGDK